MKTEFGHGLTEFGPPMWQAEADSFNSLSASPPTAVGQTKLTLAKFCYGAFDLRIWGSHS